MMKFGWLLPFAVTLAGIFAVAYSLRFIHDVFLQRRSHRPAAHAARAAALDEAAGGNPGGAVPAGRHPAGADGGTDPGAGGGAVLQGPPPEHDLAIWHGVSPALWMSVIACFGGIALLYLGRKPLFPA
jgi:multicomponent K+:H+ antiporter subunit A